jgi:hypothetical protein
VPRQGDQPAVLYAFEIPTRWYLIFEQARPRGFPALRPARQRARFLHGGWGLSENAAARFLCLALYLDPGGDFGATVVPDAWHLFPGPEEDWLGEWLMGAKQRLHTGRIADFLASLYWVVAD